MPATATDRLYGLTTSVAVKPPCRVATTANITLSGLQTVDGVALAADDRVLVKNQTSSVNNGIYVANTSAWSRAPDFDGARDAVDGTLVIVRDGSTNSRTVWELTSADPVDIGSDALTFEQAILEDSATTVFIASGVGAVQRTSQNKMREIVSVKDFGAVGDGVADDTAEVQAAIDYANTNNLQLLVNEGTFLISSKLTITRPASDTKGIAIKGMGRGHSILKYTGAASIGSLLEMTASVYSLNNNIEGFKIDLTGAPAGTIGLKIKAGIWRSNFRDLYITRDIPAGVRTGTGIYMGSATALDLGCFDNKFSGLYVNAFSKNLHFQGTDLSGNTITNCPVDHSYISSGDINYQAEFYNGLSMNNTQLELAVQHGFYAIDGETMVIMGGTIESPEAGAVGIGMNANTKSVIALCDFYNNSGGNFVGNGKIGHFVKTTQSGHTYPPGAEIRLDFDGTYTSYLRFFRNGVADARMRPSATGNGLSITNAAGTELFKFDVSNGIMELLAAAGYLRLRDGAHVEFFSGGATTASILSSAGTPEGAVTAKVGSLFLRTDGGASTSLYVKESGSGNTGWIAK